MSYYWQANGPVAKHLEELVIVNQEVARNYRGFKMKLVILKHISGLGVNIVGSVISGVAEPLVSKLKSK